jgi:hypothetical protein
MVAPGRWLPDITAEMVGRAGGFLTLRPKWWLPDIAAEMVAPGRWLPDIAAETDGWKGQGACIAFYLGLWLLICIYFT